jgi:hypothetical protein
MIGHLLGTIASSVVTDQPPPVVDPHWENVVLTAEYYTVEDVGPSGKVFGIFRIPNIVPDDTYDASWFQESANPSSATENRVAILTLSNDTDFTMGSQNFCVEMAMARNGEPTIEENFCSRWWTVNNRRSYRGYYNPSNDSITFEASTNGSSVTHSARFILGTDGVSVSNFFNGSFHHVALVRNSGELAVYVDGMKGSVTASIGATALFSPTNSADRFVIGALHTNIATAGYYQQGWTGRLDEVRVTKGVPRYTAAFTPVLPYPRGSDDPNWSSVLCLFDFSNYTRQMEDGSAASGISGRGYGIGNTTSLALINENGTPTDANGPSVYYLANSAWHLGSEDFTIEVFGLWLRSLDDALLGLYGNTDGSRCWRVGMEFGGRPRFQYSTNGNSGTVVTLTATNGASITNQRGDFCVERSGNTLRMYRNGEMLYKNQSFTATIFNPTDSVPLAVGHLRNAALSGANVNPNGIRAFRITKGVARYASDAGYTVPSLPLPRG